MLDGGNDPEALSNYLGTFSPLAPPSTDRVTELPDTKAVHTGFDSQDKPDMAPQFASNSAAAPVKPGATVVWQRLRVGWGAPATSSKKRRS